MCIPNAVMVIVILGVCWDDLRTCYVHMRTHRRPQIDKFRLWEGWGQGIDGSMHGSRACGHGGGIDCERPGGGGAERAPGRNKMAWRTLCHHVVGSSINWGCQYLAASATVQAGKEAEATPNHMRRTASMLWPSSPIVTGFIPLNVISNVTSIHSSGDTPINPNNIGGWAHPLMCSGLGMVVNLSI